MNWQDCVNCNRLFILDHMSHGEDLCDICWLTEREMGRLVTEAEEADAVSLPSHDELRKFLTRCT